MKTINNYTKSVEIIQNSDLSIKGLKTFRGMDGIGVNANLYYKSKKVAFILDEGCGGCLDIKWEINRNSEGHYNRTPISIEAEKYIDNLVKSLPKTLWKDVVEENEDRFSSLSSDSEYTYCEETILNELIDYQLRVKDYKKMLNNIVMFDKDKLVSFKAKKKDLDKMYNTKEGLMSGRRYFTDNHKGIILNDLPQDEAFGYFDKYLK